MVKIARCGCTSGSCSCIILADNTITSCVDVAVNGSGRSGDEFKISAEVLTDPATRPCLICDTNGLKLTIAPAPNQLLCTGTGLKVPAPTIASGSCLSITGTGAAGDPFTFNTTAFQDDLAVFSKEGVLSAPYVGVGRYRFPFDATVVGVTAAVNTAPTGAAILLDVNKGGVSIFPVSTKPTIAIGAFDTGAGNFEYVPDTTAILAGDYLTVDIDQVGSTIAGSDLTVFVHYTRLITCDGGGL